METFQDPQEHIEQQKKQHYWPIGKPKKKKSNDADPILDSDLGIQVSCGISSASFQVAGQDINSTRNLLTPVLNIEPDAVALVNGKEVKSDYILKISDRLEFVKRAGEKGRD
ncbi:hypothetical protein JXQ31_02690 [candidate division KSB1 bacterium]|nr:hypothetical protein [candidate division KSB1 bacterium]